jgi:hypothetical protein
MSGCARPTFTKHATRWGATECAIGRVLDVAVAVGAAVILSARSWLCPPIRSRTVGISCAPDADRLQSGYVVCAESSVGWSACCSVRKRVRDADLVRCRADVGLALARGHAELGAVFVGIALYTRSVRAPATHTTRSTVVRIPQFAQVGEKVAHWDCALRFRGILATVSIAVALEAEAVTAGACRSTGSTAEDGSCHRNGCADVSDRVTLLGVAYIWR